MNECVVRRQNLHAEENKLLVATRMKVGGGGGVLAFTLTWII